MSLTCIKAGHQWKHGCLGYTSPPHFSFLFFSDNEIFFLLVLFCTLRFFPFSISMCFRVSESRFAVQQQVCGVFAPCGSNNPPRQTAGHLHRLNLDSSTTRFVFYYFFLFGCLTVWIHHPRDSLTNSSSPGQGDIGGEGFVNECAVIHLPRVSFGLLRVHVLPICCLQLLNDRTQMLPNEKWFPSKSANLTVLLNQRPQSTGQSLPSKHHNKVYSTNKQCFPFQKGIYRDASLGSLRLHRNKMENLHLWTILLWPTVMLKWSVLG